MNTNKYSTCSDTPIDIKVNPCDTLFLQLTDEAKQLAQIIEEDKGLNITLNTSHIPQQRKPKYKKPYWSKGRLRYK